MTIPTFMTSGAADYPWHRPANLSIQARGSCLRLDRGGSSEPMLLASGIYISGGVLVLILIIVILVLVLR